MSRLAVATLLGLSLAPHPRAQSAAAPSGLILGQVIDAATNKPIAGATVTLGGGTIAQVPGIAGGQGSPRVLTDAEGHFLFRDLSNGKYTFTAAAPGYLSGGYGQQRADGATRPFVLDEGQRAGNVVVRLWKESVIGGSVTDETGSPVTGVTVLIHRRVTVNGRPELRALQYNQRTDDRGVYSAAGIPPGDYVVSVPTGMTVAEMGQTAPDAAAAASFRASGSEAHSSGIGARSAGVRAGDFFVLPGSRNVLAGQLPLTPLPDGRATAYATTFHPSSGTLADAGVVKIGAGDERTDVDVHLRPVTTVPVSGTLLTPSGPAANFAVHLVPSFAAHSPHEWNFEAAVTATDQAGRFVFPIVAPGSYVVEAWKKPSRNISLLDPLSPEPSLWAEASIVVDAAPTSVTLNLRPGAALAGRIMLEGTSPQPRPQQFQAVLGAWFQPPWQMAFNAGPIAETRVTAAWDFTKEGVPPGKYTPNVTTNFAPPAGWFLKSATFEGQDLLRSRLALDGQDVSGIVITFSDRPAGVSGLVTDSAGRPSPDASVLVLPADYQAWLRNGLPPAVARAVAAAQTGAYEIRDLPPGDYLVVASSHATLDDWPDAAVVRALAGQATRVTLANGTTVRADLRRR